MKSYLLVVKGCTQSLLSRIACIETLGGCAGRGEVCRTPVCSTSILRHESREILCTESRVVATQAWLRCIVYPQPQHFSSGLYRTTYCWPTDSLTHSHVSSIFLTKLCRVGFHSAAATRSLSANCLFTSSAVLCVPSLILTSTRNRAGSDSSSRTRTPRPMTVAKEQCCMVGVTSTVTVRSVLCGLFGSVGVILMSGSETTARLPRVIGCSGSDMVEIKS